MSSQSLSNSEVIKYDSGYRICMRCVMDTSALEIVFDNNGMCNFCTDAIDRIEKLNSKSKNEKINEFNSIIEEIKTSGKNQKYDCLIGLSGGIDSSYLAYILVKAGLRPLAVHLDNGWNTELAVNNIHNLVNSLGIDLYTHVIDWEEFKELQKAFLKASVIDLELLSDHAINAIFYKAARKFGIKYQFMGCNTATESILPASWIHSKADALNIKDIYRKHGSGKKIKTFPFIGLTVFLKSIFSTKHHRRVNVILDLVDYNKEDALRILEQETNYKRYPYKHYESKITSFYQAYILPEKFGVDKRRAHLSSLICSKQLSREQALIELEKPLYDQKSLSEDIEYFIKKLELSKQEFTDYIKSPRRSHYEYKTYKMLIKKLKFWRRARRSAW